MRNICSSVFLVFLVILVCVSCPSTLCAQAFVKVAVNGIAITNGEITRRANFLRLVYPNKGGRELHFLAQEELINEVLVLQEAKRFNLRVHEAELEKVIDRISSGMGITTVEMEIGLRGSGVSVAAFRNKIRSQVIWQKLIYERFNGVVSVAGADVERELARQLVSIDGVGKQKLVSGHSTEYVLYEVVMALDEKNTEHRLAEAERLRKRVVGCDSLISSAVGFKNTVVKRLGKRTSDEMQASFKQQLDSINVGSLSKPLVEHGVVKMFAVCGKRLVRGDLSVRGEIADKLRQDELRLLARRYLSDMRRRAIIVHK